MDRDNIQDIFPLDVNQQALLYHALRENVDDPGLIQVEIQLGGHLNRAMFQAAWSDLMKRHEALRMSAHTPPNKKPLMVVSKAIDLASDLLINWHDVSNLVAEEQATAIATYCDEDRKKELDLSAAPAIRLTGFKQSETLHTFVWTCHHLFLDGWSSLTIVNELVVFYSARVSQTPPQLPTIASHREYRNWRKQQSASNAQTFWNEYLKGFPRENSLGSLQPAPATNKGALEIEIELPDDFGQSLKNAASALKVTQASLINGCWALLLSAISGDDDIIVGNSVSGRSFDLEGRDFMAGCFSNVLPRRSRIASEHSVSTLFASSQRDQFAAQPYEFTPIGDILSANSAANGGHLFQSLVVFENLPAMVASTNKQELELIGYASGITTNYPLTLVVVPSDTFEIKIVHDAAFDAASIARVSNGFSSLLQLIVARPQLSQAEALALLRNQGIKAHEAPIIETNQRNNFKFEQGFLTAMNAASTATEMEVLKIWQEVLGLGDIDVNADFLLLGGKSFAATRMLAMIEDQMGKHISIRDFIEAPTISALAAHIDGGVVKSSWKSLVPIQPNGTKTPLIFVHAGGGHVLFLREVVKQFGIDQPIFGLQPVGLDGECEPVNSIHQLADLYVEELRTVQPEGPYILFGHCIGAYVAFEMRRMLMQAGTDKVVLSILDVIPPVAKPDELAPRTFANNIRNQIEHLSGGRLHKIALAIGRFGYQKVRDFLVPKFGSTAAQKRLQLDYVQRACAYAGSAYLAEKSTGSISVIRAAERLDVPMDWSHLCDHVDVRVLPIGHQEMFFSPDVVHLANEISAITTASNS